MVMNLLEVTYVVRSFILRGYIEGVIVLRIPSPIQVAKEKVRIY
jgi:hypothetical protein